MAYFEEDFEHFSGYDFQDSAHFDNVKQARKKLEEIKERQRLQESKWETRLKNNIPFLKRIVIKPELIVRVKMLDVEKYDKIL